MGGLAVGEVLLEELVVFSLLLVSHFLLEGVETGLRRVETRSFDFQFSLFLLDLLHFAVEVVVVQLVVADWRGGELGTGEHLALGLAPEIVGLLVEVALEVVDIVVGVDVGARARLVLLLDVLHETTLLKAELALVALLEFVDHLVLQVGLGVVLARSWVLLQQRFLEAAVHGHEGHTLLVERLPLHQTLLVVIRPRAYVLGG